MHREGIAGASHELRRPSLSNSARAMLVDAENQFKNAGIDSARVDAEILLAHVLGISRSGISLLMELTDEQRREFEKLCQLRQSRVPLQHLTGEQGFRRLVLKVGKGVFIPRPETELLVESILRELADIDNPKLIDFCSGSGAIAIALATELINCEVTAVEFSPEAFEFLRMNVAAQHEAIAKNNSKIEILNIDLTEADFPEGSFDAVVANPPYIPLEMVPKDPEVALHDPPVALFSGSDGLDLIRVIAEKASKLLKPGGFVGIEHSELQGDKELGVPGILKAKNVFEKITDRNDFNGLSRYTVAKKI